jgi:hypothetical protein
LNIKTLQLSLIDTFDASEEANEKTPPPSFAPSTFIHSLKNWPSTSTPKRILANGIGNLLAILGSTGNICVVRFGSSSTMEEIEIDCFADVVAMAWHPASPADHHLAVLGRTGQLKLYNLLQSASTSPSGSRSTEDSLFFESTEGTKFKLLSPEQSLKLPVSRTDSFVSFAFSSNSFLDNSSSSSSWIPFTAFLVKESGDIFALCPFLPLQFRAQRMRHLIPLQRNENGIIRKWLDDVILSCQFIAGLDNSSTDWVLASNPTSYSHLQARIQGPFLIQPEPMEIRHLASFDRVVDFSVFSRTLSLDQPPLITLTSAFGSGKLDIMALVFEILPVFQLKDSLYKSSASDEVTDLLPVLALLESVDLRGGSSIAPAKRSVDARIRVVQSNRSGPILVSTDDSVVSINLQVSLDDCDNGEESSDENDNGNWSIGCEATFLVEKLNNHVLCVSGGKLFPGLMRLPAMETVECKDLPMRTGNPSGILESITKFAFPLGKMEIESGAVQLQGLLENLTDNLKRLKTKREKKSPQQQQKKLPEIDEISATELNDHVSEWQESLVSPAMRVGHEIALRSSELVEILKREREILVRAKTLLTAKPDKLGKLLTRLSDAQIKNRVLLERSKQMALELSKHSVYDGLLIEKLSEISRNFREHAVVPSGDFVEVTDEDPEALIRSQLAVQNEKLLKLKNQLQNRK